ncbi:MAG: CBS domain-containing protein [Planctomycetes bacterium]|nr:CBS domain-containing protein [Planctomycetota bacterium]
MGTRWPRGPSARQDRPAARAGPGGPGIGYPTLYLFAWRAEDLMSPDPVTVAAEASVKEAASVLTDRGFGALPVVDAAGLPVGVVSRTDIVRFERERVDLLSLGDAPPADDIELGTGERLGRGFAVEVPDGARVRDIMTPMLYAVRPDTPAAGVVKEMLERGVHRVFVVSEEGTLQGVISTMDVLRGLRA